LAATRGVHVSACPKACGAPESGLTLTAEAGRYTLARDGEPLAAGLTPRQALDALACLESAGRGGPPNPQGEPKP
ncbi:MAG: hypothetical protein ACLFVF_08695, partial [Thiohalospira sp.]